jgi:DNA-binding response OmpR family regulator
LQQAPQLLLVDGDPVLCKMLADYLQGHGFGVTAKHDGETGLHHATEDAYDLVILDVMLPGLKGIEVLRRIRQQGELPVVMLSAESDDVERIVGLELGADDYLPKSCNLRELVARLHSILRRTRHQTATMQRMPGSDTAGLRLLSTERTATWRGKPLQLTSTEFNLLEVLFNHAGSPIGKAELAMSVLGHELERYDRSLDMHISNLRKKLGRLADGRFPIQTIRGAGYQLLRK